MCFVSRFVFCGSASVFSSFLTQVGNLEEIRELHKYNWVYNVISIMLIAIGIVAVIAYASNRNEKKKNLNAGNPYLSMSVPTNVVIKKNGYTHFGKRAIDASLAFLGLVLLLPIYVIVSLAIFIDDPGPVLFKQKRVGKNKFFFELHKFRSMKMSTPHDVPTHELTNPEMYITRVGRFLRKTSLDELPQIWDILRGKMSIIGPRPALWNQEDLIAERDKYGANDVMPGLTGWAQINGRDELEIPVKAALDGEYVQKQGIVFDIKCFIGTIFSVIRSDGVVEGGTGELHKALRPGVPEKDLASILGCDKEIVIQEEITKRILITGADSYIGESFRTYATAHYPNIHIDVVGTLNAEWKSVNFSGYDTVYHVAGIAHADVGKVDDAIKEKYYKINTDLAIDIASKGKKEGIKQFVFMSSMIVYGESATYGRKKIITRDTIPTPANFYGDSKWQADKGVRALEDGEFKVAVLRPPMIYGRGSKGNYQVLAKIAKKTPVFPNVDNERSMLHIDNLCEFLCKLIMSGEGGIYFPQNEEYTKTSDMVRMIGETCGKKIKVSRVLNPVVKVVSYVPGKLKRLISKAFGNSCYDQSLSSYSFSYRVYSLKESIELTEGGRINENNMDY